MSSYDWIIEQCVKLGLQNPRKSLEDMLILDYIIFNEDRHLTNFGLFRNVETLEYESFASIFDCGSSFFYRTVTNEIPKFKVKDARCKPFRDTHKDQIKLVKNLDSSEGVWIAPRKK